MTATSGFLIRRLVHPSMADRQPTSRSRLGAKKHDIDFHFHDLYDPAVLRPEAES
jgi:hypothetical protein